MRIDRDTRSPCFFPLKVCEVKLERDDDDDQMVSVVFDSHDTLYVGTSGEARACFRIHHEMLSFTVQDPYPVPEEESPSVHHFSTSFGCSQKR